MNESAMRWEMWTNVSTVDLPLSLLIHRIWVGITIIFFLYSKSFCFAITNCTHYHASSNLVDSNCLSTWNNVPEDFCVSSSVKSWVAFSCEVKDYLNTIFDIIHMVWPNENICCAAIAVACLEEYQCNHFRIVVTRFFFRSFDLFFTKRDFWRKREDSANSFKLK